MQNSTLLQLIQVLSPLEIRRLKRRLRLQKNSDKLALLDYILKHQGQAQKLLKKTAFPLLFPKKSDHKQKLLLDLMAQLSCEIQLFLQIEEIKHKDESSNLLLEKIYRERGLDKLYLSTLKKQKALLEKTGYRDVDFHLKQFQLNDAVFYHPSTEKIKQQQSFEKAIQHLDQFYAMIRLQYHLEFRVRKTLMQETTKNVFDVNDLLPVFEKIAQLNPAPVKLYLQLNAIFDKLEIKDYEILKAEVYENIEACRPSEKLIRLTFLINQLGRMSAHGLLDGHPKMLDLYKWGIKKNIFQVDSSMEPFHLVNAILLASENGEAEWAEQILPQFLQPQNPEDGDFINLCKAYIAFSRKEYHETTSHLVRIVNRQVALNLWHFPLQIRAYFELFLLNDHHLLEETILSFQRFLSSSPLSEEIKEANRNFLKIVKQLYSLHSLRKKAPSRDKIRAEFESLNPMILRKWLKAKINA